mgnify:FL=1
MTIIRESMLFRLFMVLVSLWNGSALCRAGRALAVSWQSSALGGFFRRCVPVAADSLLWREGTVAKSWQGSLACRGFAALVNLPCTFARWLYAKGKGLWDGSLLFRAFSALGGHSEVLLGLFLLVMLLVPHDYWNNLYAVAGAVVLIAFFALGSATRPRQRLEAERLGPYYLLFLAFVCYGLICSLIPTLSVRYFLFHMGCFLVVLLTVSAVNNARQLQRLVVLPVAGVVVASLYGCYQGYIGVEVVASQQDMILNAGMPGRIYSFFDNPNNFAELLAMLIPFLLALFLNARGWRGKVLSALSLVPCLVAIGMTYSRSSWIGLAIAVAVFLVLLDRRFLVAFLVVGLCAIPFLPDTIVNRILTIGNMNDSSLRYRFAIYEATGVLLRDRWFTGVGVDTDVLQRAFEIYPPMYDGYHPLHTHNNYLEMWCELGLLGGVSYIGALLYQLKRGVKGFFGRGDRRVKNLLAAAVGAFVGILVVSVAEYTWFYPRNMFLYWFLFGLIAACLKLVGSGAEKEQA